jgi:hypothetical protein
LWGLWGQLLLLLLRPLRLLRQTADEGWFNTQWGVSSWFRLLKEHRA